MKKWFTPVLSASMMLLLAACGANDDAMDRGATNHPIQNVSYKQNEPGRMNYGYNIQNRTNNMNQQKGQAPAEGIQKMSNGYITIDQNSFSTTIPSNKFPHGKIAKEGKVWVYQSDGGTKQGGMEQPKATAPTPKQQTPATQPNQQQTPTQQPKAEQQTPAAEQPAPKADTGTQKGISAVESKVIELTNQERQKNGLPALKADTALSNVAREKSNDMQKNNYFSHTSPTYGSPFDMMRDFGVSYKSAGENIAMGQRTPEEVVKAWMNSEGHRKNILSNNFTHIGVGYIENGNYWTQMFIGK
ncbi:CAP domain-containing protein [Cytobacillus spongiae]|uniref:CAP domain-containing protein n=1 Tax=Cytobacillus spongiae TaxID=2901381 RepID=UPI003D78D510